MHRDAGAGDRGCQPPGRRVFMDVTGVETDDVELVRPGA
jgi:hypothetical protein